MRRTVLRSAAHVVAGALAVAAIFLAIAAPGAGAAANASLEYSGKLQIESPTGSGGPPSGNNFGHFRVSLSWVATASTESGAPWNFHTLTGTVHWDENGNPYPLGYPECEATLSEKPGGEDFVEVTPTGADGSKLEIRTSLPLLITLIKSTAESANSSCSAAAVLNNSAYAGFNVFYDNETNAAAIEEMELAQGPKLIVPAGRPTTGSFDAKWNREIPTGAGTPYVIEITSTLNVNSRGTGGGSGSAGGTHHSSGSGTATGGRSCTVPQLKGKKLGAAKKALGKAACKLGKVTAKNGVTTKTGKVVKQSPKAGRVRKAGSKVAVKLG